MQQNSLEVGSYFLKGLEALRDQYEVVGDVRGKVKLCLCRQNITSFYFQGLMIGVELVSSKQNRTPLEVQQVLDIFEATKDMGVLFGKNGQQGSTLRIAPPMCVEKTDVDLALNVLRKALDLHKETHYSQL